MRYIKLSLSPFFIRSKTENLFVEDIFETYKHQLTTFPHISKGKSFSLIMLLTIEKRSCFSFQLLHFVEDYKN